MDKPYVSVAPFVCIAEHEELAKDYLKALDVWLLGKKNFSEFDTFPSVLTANNYNYTGNDRENIAHNRTRIIAGDAASVKDQLGQVVFELGAQEALLIPLMPTFQAKSQALTLLSESFHLASYENRD